ncbi:MAG: 3-dehydroquinate synthase [Gammaproteobacteria bacterium]|nr:3-dehydroquinate synthase [Gammaproteobacteria bacterium]
MKTNSFIVDSKQFFCDEMPIETSSFNIKSIPRSYSVNWVEDENPLAEVNKILAENPKNLLFIDKNVLAHYRDLLTVSDDRICVSDATEEFKTLDGVRKLLDFLYDNEFTKSNMLVVVGGGITQDIGGFVAASYKRGISWTLFPTTLLSMCDSCIGAKTGVNYRKAKNQIALFSAPTKVVMNLRFLKTLTQEALQSGLGEILKLCIIGGENFLEIYARHVENGKVKQTQDYKILILNALSIKKAIIEEDEFEANYRKSLNYGHTLGHVIEGLTDYAIPHGQAISIGMILVNELSYQNGLLTENQKEKLNELCLGLLNQSIFTIMQNLSTETLLDLLRNDKKVENAEVKFVFIKTAGETCFVKLALDTQLLSKINLVIQSYFIKAVEHM